MLNLPIIRRRRAGGGPRLSSYAANGTSPDLVADFKAGKYLGGLSSFGDLTFSRSGAARYMDASGIAQSAADGVARTGHHIYRNGRVTRAGVLLEPATTNILTSPNTFSSWLTANTGTLVKDQEGPDGTTSATTLVDSGAGGTGAVYIYQTVTVATSTEYTFSVKVKAGSLSWISLSAVSFTTPANGSAAFNCETGAIGTVSAGLTARAAKAENGFWRFSVSFTTDAADTSGQVRIYPASGNGATTLTLDGTNNLTIAEAQLEAHPEPTSYTATSRAADSLAIPNALLTAPTEPTNLFASPSDFTTSWFGSNTGTLVVDEEGPDGATSATTFVASGAGGTGTVYLGVNATLSANTTYRFSIRAKAGTLSQIALSTVLFTEIGTQSAFFDLSSGAFGSVGSNLTGTFAEDANGFYAVGITFTTGADVSGQLRMYLASGGFTTVPLDGSSSIIITEAKLEAVPAAGLAYEPSAVWMKLSGLASRGAGTLADWRTDANTRMTIAMETDGTVSFEGYNNAAGYTSTVTSSRAVMDYLEQPFSVGVRIRRKDINLSLGLAAETAVTAGGDLPDLWGEDIDLSPTAPVVLSQFVLGTGDVADAGILDASDDMAVDRVVMFCGQSNSVGQDDFDDGTRHPFDTIMLTQSSAISRPPTIPLDHVDDTFGRMGPDITFAESYLGSHPNDRLFLVPAGDGGTSFASGWWQDGGDGYLNAVSLMNDAMAAAPNPAATGIMFVLGETDAGQGGTTEAVFTAYLVAMVAAMREDITGAAAVPFVSGQIGRFLDTGTYPRRDDVNAAIANIAGSITNSAYASSEDLTDLGDSLHYDAASLRILGQRLAAALATV